MAILKKIQYSSRTCNFEFTCDVKDVDDIIKKIRAVCATPQQVTDLQDYFSRYYPKIKMNVTLNESGRDLNKIQ